MFFSSSRIRFLQLLSILIGSVCLARYLAILDCKSNCNPERAPICLLDEEEVCFTHFENECDMMDALCGNTKSYLEYHNEFCKLEGFMCRKEYKKYTVEYAKKENLDEIVFSIYKNKAPKEDEKEASDQTRH